jgi:hypothetical protein
MRNSGLCIKWTQSDTTKRAKKVTHGKRLLCMRPRTLPNNTDRKDILEQPGLELRLLCPPVRSQVLYRLRYPNSLRQYVLCQLCQISHVSWLRITKLSGSFSVWYQTLTMDTEIVDSPRRFY